MSTHHIACANENAMLLDPVLADLNGRGKLKFVGHPYSDDDLIRFAGGRDFGLLLPRSDMSLNQIADVLDEKSDNSSRDPFSAKASFAYSPVVFLVNPAAASRLRIYDEPLTWHALARAGGAGGSLRIRHASPRQRDGEAVALAQHLALGTDPGRSETAQSQRRSVQQLVEEYGPDDQEVLRRAFGDGWNADLVIAQERSIVDFASQVGDMTGIVVYPHDGTLVLPTSIALTSSWGAPESEEAFKLLAGSLAEIDRSTLAAAGLHKSNEDMTDPDSIVDFASAAGERSGLKWAPHAGGRMLAMPSRSSIRGIRDLAVQGGRSVDVCLVFDSSTSMQDEGKFEAALSGIDAFLSLLGSPASRVCLIRIRSSAATVVPLRPRGNFSYQRTWLEPDGNTALIDAVDMAVDVLVREGNRANIQAILAFTDGRENASSRSLVQVEAALRTSPRVRFYGIAYGLDADSTTLDCFAAATDGLVVRGGPGQIKALYERLSTYF